ncbi:high frequency lysogenization protein HflD [Natronospira bacteriovora]|uniref:High frequency lysogenization protein HflD homolog n=1 Tax=Natronospira bacteriovora TaxID=3069753 RepID=A0ABU0W9S5_9GAMM|nr:high frequency lysogenization protein HflD [Natronospira sp. AB-CW4]MDQ2070786.1 high frequency lysogenization protein HflD [Natronospira sp. AB-CW4]
MNKLTGRVVALAALFQAVKGVDDIAHKGKTDDWRLETAVNSVLTRDADSAADIFGGVSQLRDGLILFRRLLTEQVPNNEMILTRYAVAVLHLAKKLRGRPELMEELSSGIGAAQRSVDHFGLLHENVFAGLADTWSRSAGQIHPRIMVSGEDSYLQDQKNVNKVRTLLLAGIRAAVLWYQEGGSRWNLVFRRGALSEEALRLVNETPGG